MQTFTVQLGGGRTITKLLHDGATDEEIRAAFEPDMRASGIDVNQQRIERPALQAWEPGIADRVTSTVRNALLHVGMSEHSASLMAKRTFNALNDLTPVGGATAAEEASQSWKSGHYLNALAQGAIAALSVVPDGGALGGKVLHSIIAPLFHGSPYKFEKFALEKIGTGEGNQMYGHGIYLAENPSVASTYAIPRRAEMLDVPDAVRSRLHDVLAANDYLGFDTFGQAINAVRSHRHNFEKLWEVSDPDEIRAAMKIYDDARFRPSERPTLYETSVNANPADFANYDVLGPRAEAIGRANNMAGIRYLDQGSRGTGAGTHNYVVFDPSIIDILNRH